MDFRAFVAQIFNYFGFPAKTLEFLDFFPIFLKIVIALPTKMANNVARHLKIQKFFGNKIKVPSAGNPLGKIMYYDKANSSIWLSIRFYTFSFLRQPKQRNFFTVFKSCNITCRPDDCEIQILAVFRKVRFHSNHVVQDRSDDITGKQFKKETFSTLAFLKCCCTANESFHTASSHRVCY